MATESTIILGGGIVGLSTAYFLFQQPSSTPPQSIHVVDSSPELFKGASGFAGGFLARNWFEPSTSSLGALSFDLHKQLADEHNGWVKWGYRRSKGYSLSKARFNQPGDGDWIHTGASRATVAATHEFTDDGRGPPWMAQGSGNEFELITDDGTTAQVEPRDLCNFLYEQCVERGVKIETSAKALSVSQDMRGELATVRIAYDSGQETDVPCTRLVITAGPWTPKVFRTLFPNSSLRIPITPLAGHSIVVHSPQWEAGDLDQECHSVFSTQVDGFSPEYISRAGGEIYIAGLNDANLPLPERAPDAKIDSKSIDRIVDVACDAMGLEKSTLEVVRKSLCFRPVGARGPIICRIDDGKLGNGVKTRGGSNGGVFIGAGHGPWGISQSLGTGKVLSELIENKKTSANISRLGI